MQVIQTISTVQEFFVLWFIDFFLQKLDMQIQCICLIMYMLDEL